MTQTKNTKSKRLTFKQRIDKDMKEQLSKDLSPNKSERNVTTTTGAITNYTIQQVQTGSATNMGNSCNICGYFPIGFKKKLCDKCRREQKKIRNSRRNNKEEYLKYKENHSLKAKELRINNPEKYKARKILFEYMKKNNIVLNKCEVCNSKINLVAHHKDYSKPLEFVTLCKSCHGKVHKGGL